MPGGNVSVIPEASSVLHIRENRPAADLELDEAHIRQLDAAFPLLRSRVPAEDALVEQRERLSATRC